MTIGYFRFRETMAQSTKIFERAYISVKLSEKKHLSPNKSLIGVNFFWEMAHRLLVPRETFTPSLVFHLDIFPVKNPHGTDRQTRRRTDKGTRRAVTPNHISVSWCRCLCLEALHALQCTDLRRDGCGSSGDDVATTEQNIKFSIVL